MNDELLKDIHDIAEVLRTEAERLRKAAYDMEDLAVALDNLHTQTLQA